MKSSSIGAASLLGYNTTLSVQMWFPSSSSSSSISFLQLSIALSLSSRTLLGAHVNRISERKVILDDKLFFPMQELYPLGFCWTLTILQSKVTTRRKRWIQIE